MINVIVIGSGAYVSGKNTQGFGTILPSLIEGTRKKLIDKITIVSKHSSSLNEFRKKTKHIEKISNVKLNYNWHLKKGNDDYGYRNAIDKSNKNTIVIVAVPDNLHYKITKYALDNKKHVIVVKPLSSKVSEAKSLIAIAKKNNLLNVVDFHKRYDLANLKIYDMLKSKKLGELLNIHVEYSQQKDMPMKIFKSWINNTNIFQYLGVHYVDIISYVTNAKPIRVSAIGQKNFLKNEGINTFDAIQVIIEWKLKNKNFTSTFLCNWIDPNSTSAVSYQSIKFIGTKGRIESDQKNRGLQIITDDKGIEDVNPYFNQNYTIENDTLFKGYGIESFIQFFKDCNKILKDNKSVKSFDNIRSTFANTLNSVLVIESVNKSLKSNGKWIKIE
ncbi:Gfo/Idh/MocA family oxidoreductase [Candidatus Nitrosopelagicus sp.]|nr:Gfo/Idh/MocA family oxidoreductase [Candidatus Nitrosopelagicus sp.]